MRIRQRAVSVLQTVLFSVGIAAASSSLKAESEVHFRLVDHTLIVITVNSLSGAAFDFVLDTGADTTVVDSSIAGQLSFLPKDEVDVASLGGSHAMARGIVPNLSLGRCRVEDLPVLVEDLHDLRRLDHHIGGIVGQNFLAHINYLLDYRRQVLEFDSGTEIRDSIDGEHVAVETRGDRIMVSSNAQSRGRAILHLVLDSGADSVILLHSASDSLNLPRRARLLKEVAAGQREMQSAELSTLAVGPEKFHGLIALLPDADPGVQMGDGLLPTILFRSLYVNNREGYIVFNPRIRRR